MIQFAAIMPFVEKFIPIIMGGISYAQELIKGHGKGSEKKGVALEKILTDLKNKEMFEGLPEGKVKEIMESISAQIDSWIPILKSYGLLETKYDVQPSDIQKEV